MTGDVDGIIALLQAVGVDSSEVDRVTKNLASGNIGTGDEQIAAMVRKLQAAQQAAPNDQQHFVAPAQPPPPQQEEEEEDDDEFDENADYPMVGAGCSDDISVVSDLTTPTVLTGVPVPEEEHYRDTLPPMIVGGGGAPAMMIQAPKRKNLVSQVRAPAGGLAPPQRRNMPAPSRGSGGAAASRRKNYNSTMEKLGDDPRASGFDGGPKAAPRVKKSSKGSSRSVEGKPKKVRPKQRPQQPENFSDMNASSSSRNQWESSPGSRGGGGWGQPKPASPIKSSKTMIDDDGFLVGDSFDPFASGPESNPFKSSAGDLEFGGSRNGRDAFNSNHSANGDARRKKRPEGQRPAQSGFSSQQPARGLPRAPSGEGRRAPDGTQQRPRRSRRASLAM